MVSVKLKFRPSSVVGKDGNLYYQVICKRKVRMIATGYRIAESEWNPITGCIIIHDNSLRIDYLQDIKNKTEHDKKRFKRIVKKMILADSLLTVETIVEEFQKQTSEMTLFQYMEKQIERLWRYGQYRTSETYKSALNSFRQFREGVDVYFDEIDSDMLLSYEHHMKAKGLVPNTISFYMKRIRAVYNSAVESGVVDDNKPFSKVFTSSEKTIKRAIPLKYVRILKNMDLSHSKTKSFARDMFLFSFYTRGMSFVDIFYLQKKNLKDGVLTYRRKKTGHVLTIRWEDCMQEIVDRYSSPVSPFLISIIKNPEGNTRTQYRNALIIINNNLKVIGKEMGLSLPLTMYVARHSWASMARDEGIPLSVISEGLGHDSESTTQVYLASLETWVVDEANKRILELLLE